MWQVPLVQLLTASVIAGILGVSSFLLTSSIITAPVSVTLTPQNGTLVLGETLTVTVQVSSTIPVNVFKGLLTFDAEKLSVTSISYNTSIADLWAEEPWYSNGAGTINFTGGTTKAGGFVGEGSLITITFSTKATGEASLTMNDMRVLKHDGFGTDVPLPNPIDAVFAVAPADLQKETLFEDKLTGPIVTIVEEKPNTDLNNDGKKTIADVSIFMSHLVTQNKTSDFNKDGVVDLKDLSILNQ